MKKHKQISELLTDFVLGELSEEQNQEVKIHLEECLVCREEVKRLERLLKVTSEISNKSVDEKTCESAKAAIFRAIEKEQIKERTGFIKYLGRAAAIAAVITITAVIILMSHSSKSKKVDKETFARQDNTRKETETITAKNLNESTNTKVREELKTVDQMYAAGDKQGLMRMLTEGQYEAKIAAANYLGTMKETDAIGQLKKLSSEYGASNPRNPFARAIRKIQNPTGVRGAANPAVSQEVKNLTFTVINQESKEPIADAKIDIVMDKGKSQYKTNQKGQCTITLRDGNIGNFAAIVSKENYVPMETTYYGGSNRTIGMEPAVSIGGFVKDQEGQPVKDVNVVLGITGYTMDGDSLSWPAISDSNAKTDVNGFWRYDCVPQTAKSVSIYLNHKDYVEVKPTKLFAPISEQLYDTNEVRIVMRALCLNGKVLNDSGLPVEGAIVESFQRGLKQLKTQTDSEGNFHLEHLNSSPAALTILHNDYALLHKNIFVEKDNNSVEITLGPPEIIRGQVVDANNRPLKDVQVSSSMLTERYIDSDKQIITDSNGNFEWKKAPKGEVLLNCSKDGYQSSEISCITPLENKLTIVLYPPISASGSVVDAESNEPIKEFQVTRGIQEKNRTDVYWDERGRKSYETFYNGKYATDFKYGAEAYRIKIKADGYETIDSEKFYNDKDNVVINFKLRKANPVINVTGKVYLPDSNFAENAKVYVCTKIKPYFENNIGNFDATTVTDSNGSFTAAISEKPFSLVVIHEKGMAEISDQDIREPLNINLFQWGRAEGTYYTEGKPKASQEIRVVDVRACDPNRIRTVFRYNTVTDLNGHFVFEKIQPNSNLAISNVRELSVSATNYANSSIIRIPAGQTMVINIGGAGRKVIARLILPDGYKNQYLRRKIIVLENRRLAVQEWAKQYFPGTYEKMSDEDRQRWLRDFYQTNAGREFKEQSRKIAKNEDLKEIKEKRFKSYSSQLAEDGTISFEDVEEGTYTLAVYLNKNEPEAIENNEVCGINYSIDVADANESPLEKPLELGDIKLEVKKIPKIGDAAPAFEVEQFDGDTTTLSDYKGKVLLLHLCAGSQHNANYGFDVLRVIYKSFQNNAQFAIVSVALDNDIETSRLFFDKKLPPWESAYQYPEKRKGIYKDYCQYIYPTIYLIDKKGRIAAAYPLGGFVTYEDLAAAIKELLAE